MGNGYTDEQWERHIARLDRWLELSRRQGGRCGHCKRFLPVGAGDPHHIRRRSQGGTDDLANLVLLHRECHQWVHRHPRKARQAGLLHHHEDTNDR